MTKLFLIAALMTLSLGAFAQAAGTGQTTADASANTANENCDVSVVSNGGEADASSGDAANTSGNAGSR